MLRIFDYIIPHFDRPITVLNFLKQQGYSHAILVHLKKTPEGILRNGKWEYVNALLDEGDHLRIVLSEPEGSPGIQPISHPLTICYEDEDILVVNKPSGMPVHPSQGHYENTLANAVCGYFHEQGIPYTFRCVNRLDRDTSGVCLVANSRRSAYILCEQMKDRGMEKKYLALLDGVIDADNSEKIIKNYIKRKEGSTMMREVSTDSDGDISETHYRLFAKGKRYSAVIAEPKTGRTHQLRVHFSHIGYPIAGDTMYGSANEKITRQALHAFELTFTHPYTTEQMTFRAPVPDDMLALMSGDGIECAEL